MAAERKRVEKFEIETLRHSTAHVLAAAITRLYPGALPTIGPPIENGFYYDFDMPPVKPEDFPKIEAEMKKIIAEDLPFVREEASRKQLLETFKGNKYKVELIKENVPEGGSSTIYRLGDYVEFCLGPHASSSGAIKAFKLVQTASSYWRGDEKRESLIRIYGTAWPTQKELDYYLKMREEAEKRDHRNLNRLHHYYLLSPEVGPGLVIWLPAGAAIRAELEKFEREEQLKRGYQMVYTPHIGNKQLWITSGHWDLYRDKMYAPMEIDKDQYLVKPMSCPMHMQVYKSQTRSYRDLPVRIAEIATVYRYEQAGELSGLARVRYITQDDSHLFCRPNQVRDEIIGLIDLVETIYNRMGLKDIECWLSVRDPKNKDKYLGSDEVWDSAEKTIAEAAAAKGYKTIRAEGEGKFYGPALDIMVRDALGRKWQCATMQVDFMLPERFQLEYIGEDNKPHRPVILHCTPMGSLERFVSVLIEHFGGRFPVWLSPVQVRVLTLTDRSLQFAQSIAKQLIDAGVRVDTDFSPATLDYKVRGAQLAQIPYMLVIGDKEVAAGTLAVRTRDNKVKFGVKPEAFMAEIRDLIERRV